MLMNLLEQKTSYYEMFVFCNESLWNDGPLSSFM